MSAEEENKALVRREQEELWNHTGNLDAAQELFAPDYADAAKQEAADFRQARLIPMGELSERVSELDPEAETVVICQHGSRSAYVARALRQAGFARVFNLEDGLDAYSDVDGSMPRY